MKKLICLALAGALTACTLSACQRSAAPDEARTADEPPLVQGHVVDDSPTEGPHGETDQSLELQELEAMPTLEPVERIDMDNFNMDDLAPSDEDYSMADDEVFGALDNPVSDAEPAEPQGSGVLAPAAIQVIDPNTYQFSALTDTQMGFTFNYPSQWENLPGIYTVCYREKVEEDGDFPARVSITRKKLNHTVEGNVLNNELKEFVRVISRQYAANSFQLGVASNAETFLGKPAISDTYLAYSGDTEVKGYVIGTSVGMYLVVFHFCATYDDYTALENVMKYMVRSVQAAG